MSSYVSLLTTSANSYLLSLALRALRALSTKVSLLRLLVGSLRTALMNVYLSNCTLGQLQSSSSSLLSSSAESASLSMTYLLTSFSLLEMSTFTSALMGL